MHCIQNFLISVFGMNKGESGTAIISILSAVIVVFLTQILTSLVNAHQEKNKREKLKEFVKQNLVTLLPLVKKQALAYEKFSFGLDINKDETWVLDTVTMSALDVLNKLDFKDTYDAFVDGNDNNTSLFNHIANDISFLNDTFQSSKLSLESLRIEYNKFNDERNDKIGTAHQIIENVRIRFVGKLLDPVFGAYLEEIENILFDLRAVENYTNSKNIEEHFVQFPLRRVFLNLLMKYFKITP
ncbi:hypothetical protein EON73_05170 [bacterium]|nr:MAG: hypothetical protein EON73_05170 [bacterium]